MNQSPVWLATEETGDENEGKEDERAITHEIREFEILVLHLDSSS